MTTRQRTLLGKLVFIFLGLILIITFSGCMGNEASITGNTEIDSKVSAAEQINTSFSLISTAESRMTYIRADLESGTFTSAKMNLNASEVDFEEALKILNNTTTDHDEEEKIIERYKLLAEAGLDRIHSMENLVLAVEHIQKSILYMESSEFNLSKKETKETNEALNASAASLSSAKEKIFTIDPNSVPVEEKSSIILLRNDLETSETMHLELRKLMDGMSPYLDGANYLFNGIHYTEAEKWGKAADEFKMASEKFNESREVIEPLQSSEYSEISSTAIKICGIMTKIDKDLPHLEAGCRYMENKRYSQADQEFNKISTI